MMLLNTKPVREPRALLPATCCYQCGTGKCPVTGRSISALLSLPKIRGLCSRNARALPDSLKDASGITVRPRRKPCHPEMVALVLTSSCSMYFAILACIVNNLFVLYPESAVFKITTTGILDFKVILTLLPVFENTKVVIEFFIECLLS